MEVFKDFDLYGVSTMRTHSIAKDFYVPESVEEFIEIVRNFRKKGIKYFIVAGGSNVVFANHVETPIISLKKVNEELSTQDGITVAGCSLRVQKLIKHLQSEGRGGIEYLYSLPAYVGGCIYMNAGRGRSFNVSTSDYLESVTVYSPSEDKIVTLKVHHEEFGYRSSPFQGKDLVILSGSFRVPEQNPEETQRKIEERLERSKKYLSADKPSCGSVYKKGNRILFRLMKGMKVGDASFSPKTPNWISNNGNATGDDVIKLINKGVKFHRVALQKCEPEIIVVK